MIMKRILPFIFIFWTWACAEKVVEPPENLIPEQKMVDILHDMALLNATKISFPSIVKKNEIKTMDFLFAKYQIDSTQFAKSDKYYASIPVQYQMIYEQVEARLEKRRKILEGKDEKRKDSLKAAKKVRDSLNKLEKEIKPLS